MAVRKVECDMGLGRNCISGIFVMVSRKRFEVNPFVGLGIPLVYVRSGENRTKPLQLKGQKAVMLPAQSYQSESHPARTRFEHRAINWSRADR